MRYRRKQVDTLSLVLRGCGAFGLVSWYVCTFGGFESLRGA